MAESAGTIQANQRSAILEAKAASQTFLNGIEALANTIIDTQSLAELLPSVDYTSRNSASDALDFLLSLRPSSLVIPRIFAPVPTAPDLTLTPVADISVPEFTGTPPSVSLPQVPTVSLPDVPAQPTIQDIPLPSAPTVTLPTAPTVGAITIPPPPAITIPEFTAGLPSEDFFAPTNNFEFNEEEYSSELLDAVVAKLLGDVRDGGYGIEPHDEADLWNRARDRETETALMEVEEVYRTAGARGFPLPPNDLQVSVERTHKALQDKLSSVSRDIAVRRSELYVQSRQFALQESRQVESMLLNYHNAVQERALNAAKTGLDAAIAVYEAQLKRYNARLDAYKSESVVFEAKVRAALSQVEIYRVQIQSKQVEADIQRQSVEVYKAQLAGIEQTINIYRSQMEAANVAASVQRTKIEAFRSLIDAYVAQVNAGNARLQMFESQIRGELAKVNVYEAQVRAFNAQTEGAKAKADIALGRARAETEHANALLTRYRGQLESSDLDLKAQIAQLQNITQVYQAEISSFNAAANAAGEAYRLQLQAERNDADVLTKNADIKIHNAQLWLETYKAAFGTRLEAGKIGVDYYKNWMAGLTSALIGIATTEG